MFNLTPEQARAFSEQRTLENNWCFDLEKKSRKDDTNLATAVIMLNIDPSRYLDMKAKDYFKMVCLAVLSRLSVLEMMKIVEESVEWKAEKIYQIDSKAPTSSKGRTRQLIDNHIKISDIAKEFGIKVKKGKAVCPFHADGDPSLSLNDVKNVFYCFGCHAKGDIIEFYRRLKNG